MTDNALTREQIALLSCPFCGDQPHVTPDDSYGACHICCTCEHEPTIADITGSLDEAKKRWNRRSLSSPAEVERFREAAVAEIGRLANAAQRLAPTGDHILWRLQHNSFIHARDVIAALPIPPSEPQPQPEDGQAEKRAGWIPVSERLPKPGVKVIAFYRNSLGKVRRIRAEYVPQHHREDDGTYEGDTDCDETTGTPYWPEGWYESNEHEEINWRVEETVTHWQPLPAPPLAAAESEGG